MQLDELLQNDEMFRCINNTPPETIVLHTQQGSDIKVERWRPKTQEAIMVFLTKRRPVTYEPPST